MTTARTLGNFGDSLGGNVITISNTSNVGIGTSTINAGNALAVYGGNVVIGTTGSGLRFPDGTTQATAASAAAGTLLRAPQVLTSGTSYTAPSNCTKIYVELVGGGGSGGANNNSQYTGGGGGVVAAGGTSVWGGNGGAGVSAGAGGIAGTQPGGGGGGTATGTASGKGGDGKIIVTIFPA